LTLKRIIILWEGNMKKTLTCQQVREILERRPKGIGKTEIIKHIISCGDCMALFPKFLDMKMMKVLKRIGKENRAASQRPALRALAQPTVQLDARRKTNTRRRNQ